MNNLVRKKKKINKMNKWNQNKINLKMMLKCNPIKKKVKTNWNKNHKMKMRKS